ncbi:hypothetical protein KUCAC02_006826 [Chaenocephalus aceratus]|uniref:Uncharacterized protein n=1 Tax=Chaenocephalus aceratus TaxID=36190 RepID=A0ACB9VU47_CHAAC|nr:hypothetical protein KUCAC02_006826 [Chaenocephalus aceratus]
MSSWSNIDASGASAPEIWAGQTLFSSSSAYSVLEFIGEGCFGRVAECRNLATRETVAIKILKKDEDSIKDIEKEVSMLKVISVLNPDHSNVVKFFERFDHLGQTCLAFEKLDQDLYQLMQERDWVPLALKEIFTVAKQLLVALDALKGLGILHTDIKPENIMCVNQLDQPFKVKLIDFGLAITSSKVQTGLVLQPLGYRSPEISLGLPFTEAIDVWGVGCILSFLYLANNLFPVECEYQMIMFIVDVLGQPEDHMLRAGKYTKCFFIQEVAAHHPTWRLKLPDEMPAAIKIKAEKQDSSQDLRMSLDDLVNIYPKEEDAEFEDRKAFVDLLKQLLHVDGDQRISPQHALQHSFMTKSYLTEPFDSRAKFITSVCSMEASKHRVKNSAVCKPDLYGEDPYTCLYKGRIPPCCYEGASDLSSEGEIPQRSNEENPYSWLYDGNIPPRFYEGDSDVSSEGEIPPFSYEGDSDSLGSDGANPAELTAAASVTTVLTKKVMRRLRRFLGRIKATFCCCWTPVAED